jgi:hypothetical protein
LDPGTINLIWLSCPVAIGTSVLLGYIWKYALELPSNPEEADQYR